MTTDPDPDFPLYKAEVPCGNGAGCPSLQAPADRVNSSGMRRQSISIVGETAPNIGSDGSSEENGDVKPRIPNSESGNELQARIDAMMQEKERLTAEYEVEVQHCADLRDALEEREIALANAQAPVDAQLQEAQNILEAIQREEDATQMRVEDEIGHGARLLEAKEKAIATLELELHEQQRDYEKLKSGPLAMQDTDIEAALKAADREMSELLASVQRREETISCLNSDLRHAIEYMIAANVESAGGPQPELSREDFLPARVREHLGLSHWGETHLSILFKKYELIMSEMKESPFQPDAIVRPSDAGNKLADMQKMPHPIPKTAARSGVGGRAEALQGSHARNSGSSQIASAANQPRMWVPSKTHPVQTFPAASLDGGRPSWDESPEGEVDTLVAAVPEEGDSDIWAAASEDGDTDAVTPPPVGAADTESAAETAKFEGPCSASFAEESGMLREAMAQELLQLADTLAPAADSKNVYSSEPACELMRAAAQGDETAVRRWLPQVPAAGSNSDELFLGWTVWHVAAAYGQCGVLDLLKEDTFQKGGHHFAVLNRRTQMGLPPLGVACVTGRVEAARSLIMGMAPVDVRDVRGNTPLLWAAAGGQARSLVPLLLDARADVEASNYSGQQPDVASFLGSGPSARNVAKQTAQNTQPIDIPTEKLGEAFHLVRAGGSQVAAVPEPGLMSMAVGLLRTPSRDAVGFSRNAKAWASAQLSSEERNEGVWSEWVTNYTHAGLLAALEVGNPSADPTATHRSQQALVLTSERLLFFHAKSWSLTQVVALSELSELTISSFSVSVVIIRMHRLPDIVLDIAAPARGRLRDELQRAAGAVAATWGGADFGDSLAVRHSADPIVELYDERRNCVGTLAYVEADIFLLLPYAPNSMLLRGGDTFFFGLLDLHQGNAGAQPGQAWRWQSCFAMVKSSPGDGRRLMWCSHPNDEHCLGFLPLSCIQAVQPLDTPRGEHCFVLDCRADGDRSACALTFRAGSAQSREDWVVSVRTVQQAAVR